VAIIIEVSLIAIQNFLTISVQELLKVGYTTEMNIGFICECPDQCDRGVKFKHIFVVEFSQ
jgi:hypothetical protein